MKSKLLLLNILLLGAVVYAGMHLRDLIDEAAKRHAIALGTAGIGAGFAGAGGRG